MSAFESSWIAHTLSLHAKSMQSFGRIVTDTRKIHSGDFFVAIKGEQYDGNDFLDDAIKNGASGVLCHKSAKELSLLKGKHRDIEFFEVDDTLSAIRKLGAAWRRKFKIPVVVVAGSVGKTTTKEMLSAMLTGKFKSVLKTEGSQNGFLGIPLTLLGLREHHDIAVVEVGIDECNTMTLHMDVVHADYGILTAIGPEHLERLKDLKTVAEEESLSLLWFGAHGGVALVRMDDPHIAPIASKLKGSKAKVIEYLAKMSEIKTSELMCPLPGRHNEANFVSAVMMAKAVGMTEVEIAKGLSTFKPAYGRTEIVNKDFNGFECVVLCDYYNANPSSMKAAMELLKDMADIEVGASRIACLGDMLELGTLEEQYHRELAAIISKCGFSKIFLYGPRMKWLQEELLKGRSLVAHFDSHDAIAHALSKTIDRRSYILIKGSRGMRMEKIFG